ncbi:MAG: flagellar hook basal-body protein [Clostridiaceae bacterium]|nr:flagellar hook basal-body protein [Clostridiaceae bacterium]
MINGFYSAKTGAKSFQNSLSVTANNIANVSTSNYKAQKVRFSELMATNVSGSDIEAGNGSRISSSYRDCGEGGYNVLSGTMSYAIDGQGYFAVKSADGSTSYTRSGSFSKSEEGESYLVTNDGMYVLDANNQRISVAEEISSEDLSKVALYKFENPEALTAAGNALFLPNDVSGGAMPDAESKIIEGVEERSNVNMVDEMTSMMNAQRGLQYNLKMVQTADEIEQLINALRN